ncbi:MAG: filamentous hemagglutinin N-terminal domain-containing protein [Novosphingobium sp.]|nr:filamentous hemagglutinin N-terminal domain-containing protein [Novosphingobium sp.]
MRAPPASSSALALALATAAAMPAGAQTVITADAGNGFDAGTVISMAGNEATISGGTLAGGNLFHSFERFDLAQGDIAQWVRGAPDAASIVNVVNRVTGGDPSDIDGTLRVADMPGAAFWFLNPAGVVLGQGASIDVPGAAYFSTGHVLSFADGLSFSTVTPDGSTFSAAAPEAFGFLGGQGDIVNDNIGPDFNANEGPLSILAANVLFGGIFEADSLDVLAVGGATADIPASDPLRLAGQGRIEIAGPGIESRLDAGNARFAASEIVLRDIKLISFVDGEPRDAQMALLAESIELDSASITVANFDDTDVGGISIETGSLLLRNGSEVDSQTSTESVGLRIDIVAGDITLDSSDIVSQTFGEGDSGPISIIAGQVALENGSFLWSLAQADSSGDAGSVSVFADTVSLRGDSLLGSLARTDSAGNGGDVLVEAGTLTLAGSEIEGVTFGSGNGGDVMIRANDFRLTEEAGVRAQVADIATGKGGDLLVEAGFLSLDDSFVSGSTFGQGSSGNVTIRASEITLANDGFIGAQAQTGSSGNAGHVLVEAGRLSVDASTISTSTFAIGDGGNLTVSADDIMLSNGGRLRSIAGDDSNGSAGELTVTARRLFSDGGFVIASTFGIGDAGAVSVEAEEIELVNDAFLGAEVRAVSTGSGSDVLVRAGVITLDEAEIGASTFSSGDGGSLLVEAGALMMSGGSQIRSIAGIEATGSGGDVTVTADRLTADASFISTSTFGAGGGGELLVDAGEIKLTDGAFIEAQVREGAPGNVGGIVVRAGLLDLDNSTVSTSTFGAGDGGNLVVEADSIAISNSGRLRSIAGDNSSGSAGNIVVRTGSLAIDDGMVIASTFQDGDGGSIDIVAEEISLANDAFIGAEVRRGSTGMVGDVSIEANLLEIDASTVSTTTFSIADGGDLSIIADQIRLTAEARIRSEASLDSTGNAGNISIESETLFVGEKAEISADTLAAGDGGNIAIRTNELSLIGGGNIESDASFGETGNAGDILILANRIVADDGDIQSSSFGAGNGGNLEVQASEISLANSSNLSTNTSFGTTGKAGSISVVADRITANASLITAATFGDGKGGNLTIETDDLSLSDVSVISTSTFGGIGAAGSVTITARSVDLDHSFITGGTSGPGNGGTISITASTLALANGAEITARTSFGTGTGGDIFILADAIRADSANITSSTFVGGDGGGVSVSAREIVISNFATISSESVGGAGDAGNVFIDADSLVADGAFVSSASLEDGDAGSVLIASESIEILNDAAVTSDSQLGPAGNIEIVMPQSGILRLAGAEAPGTITTTSGSNTGGRITISNPLAIISNGGSIRALGETAGANVRITSDYFLQSADRFNEIAVAGDLVLDSQFSDLSAGIETPDISFLDASSVLSGQCAGTRATGQASRFTSRVTGPYVSGLPIPQEPARSRQPLSLERLSPCG